MTLVKYLYKKFFPVFLGALVFFSFILILVDLLMNIWEYISMEIPFSSIMMIELLYVPKTISFSIPLSVLFATSYVLSDLYAKNELTVIFASGIPLFTFSLPLLVLSVILSFGVFFFEDNVVVPTYKSKNELQNQVLKKSETKNNDKIVVLAENGKYVYKADYYDDKNKKLYNFFIIERDETNNLKKILYAESVAWKDNSWRYNNNVTYSYKNKQLTVTNDYIELNEPPETFQRNVIDIQSVNTKDARAYISLLNRSGMPTSEALSEYYKKYSYCFAVFIVVFISIGLTGRTKKNVLLMSLVFCLSTAVCFYVMMMVTMLMAKFEVLNPFVAAWFPVIFFTALSIGLVRSART